MDPKTDHPRGIASQTSSSQIAAIRQDVLEPKQVLKFDSSLLGLV